MSNDFHVRPGTTDLGRDYEQLNIGKKVKLSKRQIKRVITFCVLSHLIKPLSFTLISENIKLLQKAISEFDVTVFEKNSYHLVRQLWGNKKCQLENRLKDINELRTTYQLNFNRVNETSDLNDENCSQLLWLMDICPLIVSASLPTFEIIQLCHQEKFILIGNQREDQLQNRSVFQNLSDLYLKSEVHYKIITTAAEYSVQGKEELPLHCLTEENEEFRRCIATDDVVKMLHEIYLIGGKRESFDFPYIDRSLTLNIIDFEYLKKLDEDTVVVIDCLKDESYDWLRNFNLIEVEDFLQKRPLSTKHMTIRGTKIDRNVELTDSAFKPDLYFTKDKCTKETFQKICEFKSATRQHHLRVNNGRLQWIRSLSNIAELEPFREENDFVKETDLRFIENKINLIIGEPGMGKSVLMRSLKNKFPSTHWTIILYTEDISLFLDYKNKYSSISNILEQYILHEKFKNMECSEKKMLAMLMRKNHVIYVWDGLDELSVPNIRLITDIILELYKKNFCQWITCRCHLKNYLERKFNVFSKTIIQFSEDQQSAYIKERMKEANHTEDNIKHTIQKIKKLIVHHEILGIPLQIFMLTELFLKNADKYSNLSEDIFNIIDLYQYFIDEKFDIYYRKLYFKDYPQEIHYREDLKQDHKDAKIEKYRKAALKTLVPSVLKETSECDEFLDKIKEKHDPIGIITEVTEDNIPYFIHKSFAEYFVATYFVRKYTSENSIDSFQYILFQTTNRNIRFFFDLLLARNSPAHVAVLYKSMKSLTKHNEKLKQLKDLGNRNVLHIACSWGQEYPPFNVRNNNETYTLDTSIQDSYSVSEEDPKYVTMLHYLLSICNLSEQDDLLQYTSLAYAERTKSLYAKAIILRKQNYKFSRLHEDLSMASFLYYSAKFSYIEAINLYEVFPHIKTHDGSTYLHLAVCQTKFFLELLKIDVYRKMINYKDAAGLTPLAKACREGHYEVVKYLTSCNASINFTCHNDRTPLHYACQFGHEEIVLWLIKIGADFNVKDRKGWTPLHWACYNGHFTVVDLLLKKEVDANMPNGRGWTPLQLACISGRHEIVELLLTSEVDVNMHRTGKTPTELDWTPLHSACWYGHEKTVEVLLKFGSHTDHKMINGRTALHYACEKGHLKIVQLLCRHPAIIDVATDEKWTPLHFASNNGNYAIVKLLIKVGSPVNVSDTEGWTPLHLASYKGHTKVVRLLISKGAKIDVEANDGRRPIHYACQVGNDKTVKRLLKHGCQINAPDNKGFTSLHLSCLRKQETVVTILAERGADVNSLSKKGKTALHVACQYGHYEIVKILLKFKANLNIADNKGIKPIHAACYNGHESIVRLLVSDTNIDATNNNGWTPLHYACLGGHTRIVDVLISAGASINSKTTDDGWNTLHIASQHGRYNIASLLLSKIDINSKSKTGKTALHVACENNHHKVAWLLISSNAEIDSYDETKCTPLHLACEKGHLEIIHLLVTSNADINTPNDMGWTCLHLTSINGNADVCHKLLKYTTTYVDAVDNETKTAFYLASQHGHETICNILVKNGANISIKAEDGTTALHVACQYQKIKIVQLILDTMKQDINVEDFEGYTPLHLACEIGDYRIVDLLIKFKVDVNVKSTRDKTPLHVACENGYERIVFLLLKAGAEYEVYTKDKETPVYLAVLNGHQKVIELLHSHPNKNVCCTIL